MRPSKVSHGKRIHLCDLNIDDELDELCTHLHTTSTRYGTLNHEKAQFDLAIADMSTSTKPTTHGPYPVIRGDARCTMQQRHVRAVSQVQNPSANKMDGQLGALGLKRRAGAPVIRLL